MANHNKQFKEDAVRYYQDHKDLGLKGSATNLVCSLEGGV